MKVALGLVNSHIQMPKLLLKRFHNEHQSYYAYDVSTGFINKNGSAKSTNTILGYYSNLVEDALQSEIESPFGTLLTTLDSMLNSLDLSVDRFSPPPNYEQVIFSFVHALMARDPYMLDAMKNRSGFSRFLSEIDQHDIAVILGMSEANEHPPFPGYKPTFMVNTTSTPFVLPVCGMYDFRFDGHIVINLPISKNLAITLISHDLLQKMRNQSGAIALIRVDDPLIVQRLNSIAFQAQVQRKWGWVVCPNRAEIDRLIAEQTLISV